MAAEEKLLYPPLEKEMRDRIADAREEHEKIRKHLEGLTAGGDMPEAEWTRRLERMKQEIQHHVRDEESEILPRPGGSSTSGSSASSGPSSSGWRRSSSKPSPGPGLRTALHLRSAFTGAVTGDTFLSYQDLMAPRLARGEPRRSRRLTAAPERRVAGEPGEGPSVIIRHE